MNLSVSSFVDGVFFSIRGRRKEFFGWIDFGWIEPVDDDDLAAIIDVFFLGTLTREWQKIVAGVTTHGGQHVFLLLFFIK